MEEDAGKSIHDVDVYDTLVDLNRAGTPLLEIVTEPDLRSSAEAYQYLTEVRKLVRYLEICDGNMEEGSMRCDANISVRLKGDSKFGTKVEVKNMNSIRNVQKAIEFEINRQIEVIESGGIINQETRGFDALNNATIGMRSKEAAMITDISQNRIYNLYSSIKIKYLRSNLKCLLYLKSCTTDMLVNINFHLTMQVT